MRIIVVTENDTGKVLFEGTVDQISLEAKGQKMVRMVDMVNHDGVKRMDGKWTAAEKA
jgi:hypothetical protein